MSYLQKSKYVLDFSPLKNQKVYIFKYFSFRNKTKNS